MNMGLRVTFCMHGTVEDGCRVCTPLVETAPVRLVRMALTGDMTPLLCWMEVASEFGHTIGWDANGSPVEAP